MVSACLDTDDIEHNGFLQPEFDSRDWFEFNAHKEQQLHQQQPLEYSEQQSPLEDQTVIRGREELRRHAVSALHHLAQTAHASPHGIQSHPCPHYCDPNVLDILQRRLN